ncbi:MAG TPA: hypothetical protein VFU88_16475 [Ktedonobacterales bacterium]|nr:hypothetical protein [Ktedonobacterales bacterium]
MTPTYDEILHDARRLEPAEQLRLAEQLIALARLRLSSPRPTSIKELRGLGKELWEGIDAQEYVNRERDSWGG